MFKANFLKIAFEDLNLYMNNNFYIGNGEWTNEGI